MILDEQIIQQNKPFFMFSEIVIIKPGHLQAYPMILVCKNTSMMKITGTQTIR